MERCCAKLKQFRAVATRYDKRERIYQGTIDVASISIWLRAFPGDAVTFQSPRRRISHELDEQSHHDK